MTDITKKQPSDKWAKLRQRNAESIVSKFELEQIEERLKSLMDAISDFFVLFDSDLNIIDVNKAGLRMMGKNKEELIGKNIFEMSPNLKESTRYESYMEVLKTGKPFHINEFIPDPIYGNLRVTLRAFKVGDGLGLVMTNITERKRAEERLRSSEKRFRELVELLPAMVVETDCQGKVTFMNNAVVEAFGYSKEDFEKGINTNQLALPRDRERHEELFAKRISGKDLGITEYKALRKDGSCFSALVRSRIIKDDKGDPVGTRAIIMDITERKKAEEELRQAYELMEKRVEERTKDLRQSNQRLKTEIKERIRIEKALKEREKDLENQTDALEQKNITLREVIAQIEVGKRKIKEDIMANLNVSINPILEKLKMGDLSPKEVDLLIHHVNGLTSSFGSKVIEKNMNLTPREIEICNMIKGGLTNKEISRLQHISHKTVEGHRKSIRRKLGLTHRNINLTSYLQQL